jgi:hypothetical protein
MSNGQYRSPSDGKIRWRWLEHGHAGITLQEFMPQRRPNTQASGSE